MGMASVAQRANLADLYLVPGKAELIGGRIVEFMPTGRKPSRIAFRIARSLDDYVALLKHGEVFGDNLGYSVPILPSGRESFSPDASYYAGPFPSDPMRFIVGPPTFAAEVRSETDYDASAEIDMADKRHDYFLAGTLVVWDVDTLAELIHVYRHDQPDKPTTFGRGQSANAEPAVPGWTVAVDWLFA
jgi:Uma2 family endonuclease